ncbi:hypothetical protein AWC36_03580 [Brenneria goodwinii]|nr:hypothetical protein AWC36_03580 [Brenneria goodwinii]
MQKKYSVLREGSYIAGDFCILLWRACVLLRSARQMVLYNMLFFNHILFFYLPESYLFYSDAHK